MYAGEVVEIYKEYHALDSDYPTYGVKVVIESRMADGSGFRHTYAHLAHHRQFLVDPRELTDQEEQRLVANDFIIKPWTVNDDNPERYVLADYLNAKTIQSFEERTTDSEGNLIPGTMVARGARLGVTGKTKTDDYHLHVHLQAFNSTGVIVPSESIPGLVHDDRYTSVSPGAQRIYGCMNFNCFLPPDTERPAITAEVGQLLSPRDAWAEIPVYTEPNTDSPLMQDNRAVKVWGKYLGCYALLATRTVGSITWYQIQVTQSQTGWVQQRGNIYNPRTGALHGRDVIWVRVESVAGPVEETLTLPPRQGLWLQVNPDTTLNVRSTYSTEGEIEGTVNSKQKYAIGDRHETEDPGAGKVEDVWWQIRLDDGTVGWVADHQPDSNGTPRFVTVHTEPPPPGTTEVPVVNGRRVTLRWTTPHVLGRPRQEITRHTGFVIKGGVTEDTPLVFTRVGRHVRSTRVNVPGRTTRYHFAVGTLNGDQEGDLTDFTPVTLTSLPTFANWGAPGIRDLGTTSQGGNWQVDLGWSPPPTVPGLDYSGYRIWRGQTRDALSVQEASVSSGISWTDRRPGLRGTLQYYAVAALAGARSGALSTPLGICVGEGSLAAMALCVARNASVPIHERPDGSSAVCAHLPERLARRVHRVLPEWVEVDCRSSDPQPGGSGQAMRSEAQATGSQAKGQAALLPRGWVRRSHLRFPGQPLPRVETTATTTRYVRLHSWVTGLFLRLGPSQAFDAYRLLTDSSVWFEVVGQTETTPLWYQIQYRATFRGWVHSGYVELTFRTVTTAVPVPVVPAPAMPPEQAPDGGSAPGSGTTSGSAAGDYRNLVTNPDGRWAVWKSGTTVTANFSSPRSPVQYYARENLQPQFVLPVGFRPTATVTHTVTGTRVNADRTAVAGAPPESFDLRLETDGEMRYVDNAKVEHLGYVSYSVTHLTWQTDEALVTPEATGTLSGNGVYLNQQEDWGSSWRLTRSRSGTRVTGSFGCTRSAVDHYANVTRVAILLLPAEYRPAADVSIQVTGAVRVNADGTDSTDARRVDFGITVQPNGEMWYDRDAALTAAGVGYLRYTVEVAWTARAMVPTAPRELETDDVEAKEVELDWRRPEYDGGDSVDEYQVERYRGGRWREVEDDISRTRYTVEELDPYTTYTFRVLAHNEAGWSEPSTAIEVTTPRETPGRPRSLAAAATHDQVTLTWTEPSGDVTVTGYRIQRRAGSGAWRTRLHDTGETATGWEDDTVAAATGYTYRVAAHNHGVVGDWSSPRSVTTAPTPTIPGQATDLSVAPGTTRRLALSWTAPSDTGGGVSGYRIERSPDEDPRDWTDVVVDTDSAALTWGEDDVAADKVYHYRVSARNSAGAGTASAEAQGRTRPQLELGGLLPYPLAAHSEPRAASAVTTTFAAYLPGRVYDLVGQAAVGVGWWQVLLFGQGSSSPFWLPAAAGTALGDTSSLPQPPAMPGDFRATLASEAVTLTWTAPASGSTVTGYRLWRQTDAGTFAQLGSDLAATLLTHTDSTVQNDHVYRYWLQGLSDVGPGVPTATVALAVMATPAVPAAVGTLNTAATTTTLLVSWTRASTGGLPTGYRVKWRQTGTTDPYQAVEVPGPSHTLTDLTPGTSYELRVTASNQAGAAAVTTGTGTTVQAAPGDPTALTVQVASNTATVSWTAPAAGPTAGGRPDAYHLQSRLPTASWPTTYTTVTGASHTLRDLAYETGYEVQVRAANTAGQSAWVSTPFTSGRARPSAVQELAAAPSDASQMALSWQTPLATAGGISGYRIERSADVEPRVWVEQVADTGTAATTWADSGLSADTVVHYRVTGRNAEGLGASTTATGRTRPRLALNATATYPLSAHAWPLATAPVTHTWTAYDATVALDVRGQAPGWWRVVRYGQGASGPYWLPARAATVTGTTTDLPAAPGVPGDLALQATHATVMLTWTAPPTGGPVTGYRLWRQTGEADFAVVGAPLAAAALSHTDPTVTASTAYQYRLQAVSAAGYGLRTAAVGITTAETPRVPGQVTDLTAAPTAESQMSLSWTAPTDPGTQPLTGYQVARAPDAEPRVWTTVVTDTGTTDLTWHDRGLPASTVYHYRVSARSSVGGGTASAAATGTTRPQLTLLATAPYPLTAHQWPAATAPVTHTWSAHAASVSLDLVGQGAGGGGWWRGLRFGHTASGPYWLPASAVGTQGTTSDLPQVPGAPADLATSAAADAVTLSWSAPTTGGPVTGYRLWRQSGEAAFSVQGDDLAADALTYKDTAVTASTTYQYRLQAQAAVGPGLRTAAVSATTPAAPAPGVPADVACNYRNGRVTVYWDPPPTGGPVTHYLLWQQIDSGTWALTGDPVATGRSYYSYRFAAPADADTLAYEVQAVGPGGAGLRSDTTSLIVPS